MSATTLFRPRRIVRGFARFAPGDRALLLLAWPMLGLSRLAVLTIPFRRLAPQLGELTGTAPWQPLLTPQQQQRALWLGRLVRAAARYTPWDSNCFAQAITARFILGWHGIPYTLMFGLARSSAVDESMRAHAWVMAGPIAVTGGYAFGEYTVVGCYCPKPLLKP